ncbi:hypothetical protein [Methyloglobulus sp.]|uniref:hypothetical protein n=1 Tax=Methyloglobulus sp. TaxID=2518622 RepID=UPI0032B768B7
MEALRNQLPFVKRHFFSVAALYRFVSYYGTSVGTALRIMFWLFLLHLVLTLSIQPPETDAQWVCYILNVPLRTVKILSLQSVDYGNQDTVPIEQRWIDAIFRILSPIQVTMLALAFRSRIKRN